MQDPLYTITSGWQREKCKGKEKKASHDLSWIFSTSSSTGESRRIDHIRTRFVISSARIVLSHPLGGFETELGCRGILLAQDRCNSRFETHCECSGVWLGSRASRSSKWRWPDKAMWIWSRCVRSGSES